MNVAGNYLVNTGRHAKGYRYWCSRGNVSHSASFEFLGIDPLALRFDGKTTYVCYNGENIDFFLKRWNLENHDFKKHNRGKV